MPEDITDQGTKNHFQEVITNRESLSIQQRVIDDCTLQIEEHFRDLQKVFKSEEEDREFAKRVKQVIDQMLELQAKISVAARLRNKANEALNDALRWFYLLYRANELTGPQHYQVDDYVLTIKDHYGEMRYYIKDAQKNVA